MYLLYKKDYNVYLCLSYIVKKFKSIKLKYSNCNNFRKDIAYLYTYFWLSYYNSLIYINFITFFIVQPKYYQYIHIKLTLYINKGNL